MSNADNSDFTPQPLEAPESEDSSSSDQDILAEKSHAIKKRSAAQKPAKVVKKTRANKKAGKAASTRSRTASFGSEELLLVARAFMKVSNDPKHSTDKKAEKFWDEVHATFEQLVASANKLNEANEEFTPIELGRGVESIRNCWQRRIQPAVNKFAGIVYSNPPNSGEVKDDALMDLYYSRMREEYAARSHTYVKGCPKSFHKLMQAYKFLSEHPKFEVEFPRDGSKPPHKNPNSIRKSNMPEDIAQPDESRTFLKLPSRKERPPGREMSKRVDTINFIVDKVTEIAQSPPPPGQYVNSSRYVVEN